MAVLKRNTAPSASADTRQRRPTSVFNHLGAAVGAIAAVVALSSGAAALVFALWPSLRPKPPPEKLSATIGKLAVEPNVSFGDYLSRTGAQDEYRQLRDQLLRSIDPRSYIPPAKGAAVATLQRLLMQQGVYSGPLTGVYGRSTGRAVTRFQEQTGEVPDGLAGPATVRALFRANPGSFSRLGIVLYVEVKVEGFRVRQFGPLQAHLYNAKTRVRITDPDAVPIAKLLRPLLPPEKASAVIRLGAITRSRVRPAAPIDQRGKLLWLHSPPQGGEFFVRVELYDLDGQLVDFADTPTFGLKRHAAGHGVGAHRR